MKKWLLTFVTASTLVFVGCSSNQEAQEEPNQTEEQTTETNEQTDTAYAEETNQEVEQQTQFIQEAFDTLLDYDTESYQERNEQASSYFSAEALEAMVGNEHINPEITFNSSTSNEKVYQSLQGDEEFIYIADVDFQVEDNPTTTVKNIYEFDIIENNDEYRIDNVDVFAQPEQPVEP